MESMSGLIEDCPKELLVNLISRQFKAVAATDDCSDLGLVGMADVDLSNDKRKNQ